MSNFYSLFDICPCKCVDAEVVERKYCKCPVDCKIPIIEWNFWIDQKTTRKMVIGKVDSVVSGKMQKLEEKKEKLQNLKQKREEQLTNAVLFQKN